MEHHYWWLVWCTDSLQIRSSEGDIAIYQAFQATHIIGGALSNTQANSSSQDRLALRFKRLKFDHILHRRTLKEAKDDTDFMSRNRKQMIPFSNVSGHSGVFFIGLNPMMLILAPNGQVFMHPFKTPNSNQGRSLVLTFSPFHNIHCQNGLIYVDANVSFIN